MLLALCGPAVAQAADTAPAADNNESVWSRDKLTGDDWFGVRSGLSKHGVDIGLRLSQYGQRVTTGGVDVNGEAGGTMDYRLNIDGDKLFGAKGFAINVHARTRWGKDVSADAGAFTLENMGMLMPAPGDYEDTDITGLTVSQNLPIFGLSIVEVGKLDVVDLVTLLFPSVSYGQEGFWNLNSQVSTLPWLGAVQGLSLYGGLGVTVNQEHKIIQSGVLLTGTENVTTRPVGKGSLGGGTWIAAFHRFLWTMDGQQGYFMIFAGGSTRDQPSTDPHDFVFVHGQGIESEDSKKPWDIALYLYQDFWQAKGDPKRKANFMIGGTAGPDNPQLSQYNLFANVEVFGLMDSRPRDRIGVGVWWNSIADEYEELVSPVVDLEDMYGIEIYYNVEINKWLHLTPDLQVVDTELADEDTAVIAGLRLVVDF
jgi:porin